MITNATLADRIFALREHNDVAFDQIALQLFAFHMQHNETYRSFVQHLGVREEDVKQVSQIPFLPIELFKHHAVGIFDGPPETVFLSSGTTGSERSQHHVANLGVYDRSLLQCFRLAFGEPKDYCILALLPSYLERSNASLVYMVRKLIDLGQHPDSGYYLDRLTSLSKVLRKNSASGQKTLLIGVTFALLDLAEQHPQALRNISILETGGMKGRRREMLREEVHETLQTAFHQPHICSEYGMTELLSQAYSLGDGIFRNPPWMRVYVRETHDPLSLSHRGKGALNVIDLANMNSCPFIATQDLGQVYQDGSFEILGRLDYAEMRGCNLMVM
jgi:phenylacetate-coenzyme A ligase PaaK-like adenylate-forming protein